MRQRLLSHQPLTRAMVSDKRKLLDTALLMTKHRIRTVSIEGSPRLWSADDCALRILLQIAEEKRISHLSNKNTDAIKERVTLPESDDLQLLEHQASELILRLRAEPSLHWRAAIVPGAAYSPSPTAMAFASTTVEERIFVVLRDAPSPPSPPPSSEHSAVGVNTLYVLPGVQDVGDLNKELWKRFYLPSSVTRIGSNFLLHARVDKLIDLRATTLDCLGDRFLSYDNKVGVGITPDLEEVLLPPTLRKIGFESFSGLPRLKSLDLSNCLLRELQRNTISNLERCTEISWPATLQKIGTRCIQRCSALTNIDLSACTKLLRIGAESLFLLPQLTRLVLPPNLRELDVYCLAGSPVLEEVVMPHNASCRVGSGFLLNSGQRSRTGRIRLVYPPTWRCVAREALPHRCQSSTEPCELEHVFD